MANGRMRVSGFFRSGLVNEKLRVSALDQKSVRTIEIQELPKIDKLQLMQFLATELVKEEESNFFVANRKYPVWSPYNCSEATNVLMNLLATKQQEKNG
jgi:hypothetical protein